MSRRRRVVEKRTPPVVRPPRRMGWIGLTLILLLTVIVYSPCLDGTRLWDDDAHITKPALQSISGLSRIWTELTATQQYYPLLHSTFWLEHKLWGDSVRGYHLVNLCWHMCAVSLLYVILLRLKIPGALLAAAIFAVHPVMVESVAPMCEQKNTLSAVFYLSSVLAYLGFDDSRRRSLYALALALFALALLTKTATVTLPAALLVIIWWRRGTISWRRDGLPTLPFFALGIISGLVTTAVEQSYFHSEAPEFSLSLVQRFLLAGRAIWFYVGKLIWPDVGFLYRQWTLDPKQAWQWIFPIAALVVTFTLLLIWKRWPSMIAGWLFFCGTLLPGIGLVNYFMFTNTFVADHIQYLASLGMIVLAAASVSLGLAKSSLAVRRAGIVLSIVLLAALAGLSRQHDRLFADPIALYEHTLERNPDSWLAHASLAFELAAKGDLLSAIEHYRTAVKLRPTDRISFNNLGRALIRSGRPADGIEALNRALQLRPGFAAAHNNLASAFLQMGRYPEAVDQCHEALRLQPIYLDAQLNLGTALLHAGRLQEAIGEICAAQKLQPDDPIVCNTLGAALLQVGQRPEAIQQIEHALQVRPNYPEAHNNLAQAFIRSGQIPQAIDQFQQAIAVDDKFTAAHIGLGLLLDAQGKYNDAIKQFEKALQVDANQADVHNNLGDSLRKSGQIDRAVEHYQIAVQLKPDFMPACANLAQTLALANRSQEAIAVSEKSIELARSTGQQEALEQFEEWLKHYRTELRRAEEAAGPAPPSPTKP